MTRSGMGSAFVYVLAAALAIFVVGGVMATYVQDGGTGFGTGAQPGDAVFAEPLGIIGSPAEATSRTAVHRTELTVTAGTPTETVIEGETVAVARNALNERSRVLTFSARRPQRMELTFVPTTNTPADKLNITLNGAPLDVPAFSRGEPVTMTVDGDRLRRGRNVLGFRVTDIGLQVWRSPSFSLQQLAVTVTDQTNARTVIPFRAYDYEVTGFDRGVIAYSVTEDTVRDQPLRIAVNGNTVSERTPIKRAAPYETTFFANTTGLRPGENTLSFATTGDARYPLSNVDATLYFIAGTERRTVVRSFNMSGADYRSLSADSGGTIRFWVERILQNGPITIGLPDQEFTVENPTGGVNTVTFGQDAVRRGQNEIRVATSGSYRISAFNVTVQD